MSSIVSRRPSSRNHWNEAFWMSIRLGRSRTCSSLEKDLRARGEATLVVKNEASLGDERDQALSQARKERAENADSGTAAQPVRVPNLTPLPQASAFGHAGMPENCSAGRNASQRAGNPSGRPRP